VICKINDINEIMKIRKKTYNTNSSLRFINLVNIYTFLENPVTSKFIITTVSYWILTISADGFI